MPMRMSMHTSSTPRPAHLRVPSYPHVCTHVCTHLASSPHPPQVERRHLHCTVYVCGAGWYGAVLGCARMCWDVLGCAVQCSAVPCRAEVFTRTWECVCEHVWMCSRVQGTGCGVRGCDRVRKDMWMHACVHACGRAQVHCVPETGLHSHTGHNYVGHTYIGHNYIGHNYIGDSYVTGLHAHTGHLYVSLHMSTHISIQHIHSDMSLHTAALHSRMSSPVGSAQSRPE